MLAHIHAELRPQSSRCYTLTSLCFHVEKPEECRGGTDLHLHRKYDECLQPVDEVDMDMRWAGANKTTPPSANKFSSVPPPADWRLATGDTFSWWGASTLAIYVAMTEA